MPQLNKGLFLDFDGTLADSLPVMYELYEKFVKQHNGNPARQEFDYLNGPPTQEVILYLKKTHLMEGSLNDLLDEYSDLRDQLKNKICPAAGALALLNAGREKKYKVAIVTSSNSADVRDWLDVNHLSDKVDAVIGADSVTEGKPSPEPYLKAASLLNCASDLSIAIEDSIAGLSSAQNAKIRCLFLGKATGHEVTKQTIHINSLLDAIEYL